MKYLIILITVVFFTACNERNSRSSNSDTSNVSANNEENVKTLNEIKLLLLDARCEKAELLLGKPDKKGRVYSDFHGADYYMIYFNKVLDDNKVKNLFITIYTENGISDGSKITKVEAINEYQSIYVGRGVSFEASKATGIKCNGRGFTEINGTEEWWKVL